jgi:hypothetical protein
MIRFGSRARFNESYWPFDRYGQTREKRKTPEGYEVVYCTNFRITDMFRIIKRVNKFETSGKGYVIFDKAFDIRNRRLPFHVSMTAFIKKELVDTAANRHNEFMWWIKVN